jgi:hypothetical protein
LGKIEAESKMQSGEGEELASALSQFDGTVRPEGGFVHRLIFARMPRM